MSFQIRPATLDDLPQINDIYNEAVRETTATFDLQERTLDACTAWFESHSSQHPIVVAEHLEDPSTSPFEIVGWASLSEWNRRPAYAKTVESSVYVRKSHQAAGCGKKLYERILQQARAFGMHTVIAQITDENHGSIQFHRDFGFKDVGALRRVGEKFGRSLDVRIMQLFLVSDD